jgi:membrane protease YdiL (CAAX protease family)
MGTWLQRAVEQDAPSTRPDRLADPPERSGPAGAAIVLMAAGAFALAGVAGGFAALPPATIALLLLLAVGAALLREPQPLQVTVLALCAALSYRMPAAGAHPFPLTTALAAYGIVVVALPSLRGSVRWTHVGSVEPHIRRLGAVVAVASALALLAWFQVVQPALDPQHAALANLPLGLLPAMALFFAAVNAGVEELAFRGVLLDGLRSALGDVGAVLTQAAVFGLLHYAYGVPFGASGALLAGCYGLALGVLRLRAGGLLVAWAVHASTDLLVFVLLLTR